MAIKRTVRNEVAEVTVREDGIVIARTFAHAVFTPKEVGEFRELVAYLTTSDLHALVSDISNLYDFDPRIEENLSQGASEQNKFLAIAVVVGSTASRAIGKVLELRSKEECPIKLFVDYAEAVSWVKSEYTKRSVKMAS